MEVVQVNESDPVLALEHTRALSRVEDEGAFDFFVAVEVGVSMQAENMAGCQAGFKVKGVVGDEDGLPGPSDFQGAVDQLHSILPGRSIKSWPFALVVVPVDTVERHGQGRERIENLGLGDIAGMDDAIDSASLEDFDDPIDTG
jgi:hypothetical protein